MNLPGAEACFATNPLMGEAWCRYSSGIGYFNQRAVDYALNVYVLARCMMVALYNEAFLAEAIPVPTICAGEQLYRYFDRVTGQCRAQPL